MYRVEARKLAEKDILETLDYIGSELRNPTAASRLEQALERAILGLREFPYANPEFHTVLSLKDPHRSCLVGNYYLIYTVDEERKTVSIQRVVYARRDMDSILDDLD